MRSKGCGSKCEGCANTAEATIAREISSSRSSICASASWLAGILLTCEMIDGDGQYPDFFLERPEGQRVPAGVNGGVDLIEARTDGRKTGRSLFTRGSRGDTRVSNSFQRRSNSSQRRSTERTVSSPRQGFEPGLYLLQFQAEHGDVPVVASIRIILGWRWRAGRTPHSVHSRPWLKRVPQGKRHFLRAGCRIRGEDQSSSGGGVRRAVPSVQPSTLLVDCSLLSRSASDRAPAIDRDDRARFAQGASADGFAARPPGCAAPARLVLPFEPLFQIFERPVHIFNRGRPALPAGIERIQIEPLVVHRNARFANVCRPSTGSPKTPLSGLDAAVRRRTGGSSIPGRPHPRSEKP